MTRLKAFMAGQGDKRRASKTKEATTARSIREENGAVTTVASLGFDAASVALPADINLEGRAARMNEFWEKLVDYQHGDCSSSLYAWAASGNGAEEITRIVAVDRRAPGVQLRRPKGDRRVRIGGADD